jgi:hypothetical protein
MVGETMTSLDDVVTHLRQWRADTLVRIEDLREHRRRVEESSPHLESPQAVLEYVDFFAGFLTEAAATLERVETELPQGPQRVHVDVLRQIASNAAVEQRRCLKFRDKWINRPLPYEEVRPLLNQISNGTRDQLNDYRKLNDAAARLEQIAGAGLTPGGEDGRALDRRALFTKWFGR